MRDGVCMWMLHFTNSCSNVHWLQPKSYSTIVLQNRRRARSSMSKRANCGDDQGVFNQGQGCFISAPHGAAKFPNGADKFYACDFCDRGFTSSHKWKTLRSYKGVCAYICKRCTTKWKDENPTRYTLHEKGYKVASDDMEITFGEMTCEGQQGTCSGTPYMKKDDKEKKDDNGDKNDDQDKPLF